MEGKDSVQVIRDAIAIALVFYYPLRRGGWGNIPMGKLAVECTGEGVVFIEADANVALEEFGDALYLRPSPTWMMSFFIFKALIECSILLWCFFTFK